MKPVITTKLLRVGKLMIKIEKTEILYEADQFTDEYTVILLRLKNPYKNYEVSLMKNDWDPEFVNNENNYREVATVIKENDYINTGMRWGINEQSGKDILKACLVAYSHFDNEDEFHEHMYTVLDEGDEDVA